MEKLKGQLENYKEQPFSLVLRLLMWIATFLTVGITVCIVGRSCQCSASQRESVYAF